MPAVLPLTFSHWGKICSEQSALLMHASNRQYMSEKILDIRAVQNGKAEILYLKTEKRVKNSTFGRRSVSH